MLDEDVDMLEVARIRDLPFELMLASRLAIVSAELCEKRAAIERVEALLEVYERLKPVGDGNVVIARRLVVSEVRATLAQEGGK